MQPGATIINTSSVQAVNPSPELLDYATTKAGIHNFTKALAQELAEKGIRVNAVAPGPDLDPADPGDDADREGAEPSARRPRSAGRGSRRRWRRPTSSSPRRSPATSPPRCSPSPAARRSSEVRAPAGQRYWPVRLVPSPG